MQKSCQFCMVELAQPHQEGCPETYTGEEKAVAISQYRQGSRDAEDEHGAFSSGGGVFPAPYLLGYKHPMQYRRPLLSTSGA